MKQYLTLTPRDPIIARDGRPFGVGQGHRMRSLDWPYPSVLSGSLRTLLGKMAGGSFTPEIVNRLKEIEIAGPFPLANNQVYFPAPKDLVIWEDEQEKGSHRKRKIMPLRPLPLAEGEKVCDLPDGLLPVSVTEDLKPSKSPAFWSHERICWWLANAHGKDFSVPPREGNCEEGFFDAPLKDERIHVKIEPTSGAAEESQLFMTVGLDLSSKGLSPDIGLVARVDAGNGFVKQIESLNTFHPLGGERRLVHWQKTKSPTWDPPDKLRELLSKTPLVRLVLATPALFKDGWKPGWLDGNLEGLLPGTSIRLRLVSACIDRWKPISGWSLEVGNVGPKPVRRMVPAGSVYFFERKEGDPAMISERCWLQSVSDENQDRRDGFGLALWGIWDYAGHVEGGR